MQRHIIEWRYICQDKFPSLHFLRTSFPPFKAGSRAVVFPDIELPFYPYRKSVSLCFQESHEVHQWTVRNRTGQAFERIFPRTLEKGMFIEN